MGLLTRQERERLVQLLLQIPQIYDIEWRRLLTATLPERLRTSIPTAPDALTHVTHMLEIADSDAWVRLPNGDRPIVVIIGNALLAVSGTSMAMELQSLSLELTIRPLP